MSGPGAWRMGAAPCTRWHVPLMLQHLNHQSHCGHSLAFFGCIDICSC